MVSIALLLIIFPSILCMQYKPSALHSNIIKVPIINTNEVTINEQIQRVARQKESSKGMQDTLMKYLSFINKSKNTNSFIQNYSKSDNWAMIASSNKNRNETIKYDRLDMLQYRLEHHFLQSILQHIEYMNKKLDPISSLTCSKGKNQYADLYVYKSMLSALDRFLETVSIQELVVRKRGSVSNKTNFSIPNKLKQHSINGKRGRNSKTVCLKPKSLFGPNDYDMKVSAGVLLWWESVLWITYN